MIPGYWILSYRNTMNLKEHFESLPTRIRIPTGMLIVCLAYYLGARLGLTLAFKPDYISAVWFPNAILLAALLLSPTRFWPFWILAAFPAEIAADIAVGIPPLLALKFVAADSMEVLIAGSLIRSLAVYTPEFNRLRPLFIYFAAAVILGPLLAAFPGAWITGGDPAAPVFWIRWQRWFFSDSLTHLIVTPAIITWAIRPIHIRFPQKVARFFEAIVLTTGLILASAHTFGLTTQGALNSPWTLYLPFPLLIWVAVRFGSRLTLSACLLVSVIAIWDSSRGAGPFTNLVPAANVLNLQLLLLLSLSSVIILATALEERKRAEELATSSLADKEILLKEIHHRVKNNLQVISGLLDLQSQHIGDIAERSVYKESQNRIITMALIHEELYQSQDLARVQYVVYLENLVQNLSVSYGVDRTRIHMRVEADKEGLIVDTAIPCSLIVNELLSNSLRHAFPGDRGGNILVAFRSLREGEYELEVADDGIGLPQGMNVRKVDSLGMKLVTVLVEQLGGELDVDSSEGTRFIIRFKEYREAGTQLY